MSARVYLLGGYQTDFAENWARNGIEVADAMRHTVLKGLEETKLEPRDIEVAHVGNFAGELFCKQGHMGGLFAACHPEFAGIPASRHEGACASGSLAMLGAAAEIEAGRYGLAAVVGIEQMRNVSGEQAAQFIGGPAMWSGHEYTDARYPWPRVFSDVADEYDRRYGIKQEHLARIAQINFSNGRRNPNAQTRRWTFTERSFMADDDANPVIEGRMRKQDRSPMGRPSCFWRMKRRPASTPRDSASVSKRCRISKAGGTARPRFPIEQRCRQAQGSRTSFRMSEARSRTPSVAQALQA
jgi:acetyl-CoA C-acetyltransferase